MTPATRVPAGASFARRLDIETPEHVVLELELAGLGSRILAALCDAAILAFLAFALVVGVGAVLPQADARLSGTLVTVVITLAAFTLFWGYFLLFEGLHRGRTPGKQLLGIRVVMDTGHPLTFSAAAVRNLVRVVDAQPVFFYIVGLAFVLLHRENRRLGDIVAGTVVVRDRPDELQLASAAPPPGDPQQALDLGPPELSDDEFRLLDEFIERADQLDPRLRDRFTSELAARFEPRVPRRDTDPLLYLAGVHENELSRRRGRLATRQVDGIGRSTVTAERFIAQKRDRWESFRVVATQAERTGLEQLGAQALPGFASQYREVAADLARARTYGVDPRVLEYLERLVSAGHNALYGVPRLTPVRVWNLVFRSFPAAVIQSRPYVLVALLAFALPAVTGYLLLRENPTLGEEILPGEMVERARMGPHAQQEGVGYAEAPSLYLPVVASRIITNNVQVAFFAFAFGITAGIGTLTLLITNGLFFGAVLGLFANYHVANWLLTFVAGHGILELTAIFIAGGAGLRIARALIAPGDWSRADALVIEGHAAIRMVGATVTLLVLAGLIEGLLSASDAAAPYKFAASAASVLFLFLYLKNGGSDREAPQRAGPA
ncbi:MAG TPA: stage II sporulation protein M [Gemmatimonadales bacterium]|nr:stage II sporulation protein M [Gemmatimonadales bacterium]